MSGQDLPVPEVSKRVEEGLIEKQKVLGRRMCRNEIEDFVDCTNSGFISVVWKCRPHKDRVNECLGQYTNKDVLNEMKRQYVLEKRGGKERV